MIYRVTHTTTYSYSDSVSLSHNLLHLTARNSSHQVCHRSRLLISPVPAVSTASMDFFGNYSTFFTVQELHNKLKVTAINLTEVNPPFHPEFSSSPPWEAVRDGFLGKCDKDTLDAKQFIFESPYVPILSELRDYALPSFPQGQPLLEGVRLLTERIHADFKYNPAVTTVATPLKEVLEIRGGVCQDFAHLQIGCLRALGLSARYISGYLRTNPPPGQQRLQGADASHAWLSVFCPGTGWVDFDPTNNMVPGDTHILLAWGRDYDDVSPIKGIIIGGGQHTVGVGVDVEEAGSVNTWEM